MKKINIGIFTPRHNILMDMFLKYPSSNVNYKILEMNYPFSDSKIKKFTDWNKDLKTEDLRNFLVFRVIDFRDTHLVDVLHTSYSISTNDKPWVCSFGHYPSIMNGNIGNVDINKKMIIEKYINSDNCKFLLPWSKWGKKAAEAFIKDSKIIKKIRVVYPKIKVKENIQNKDLSKIKFLFVANPFRSGFERKGGLELLKSFNTLSQKYNNISLTMIGQVNNKIIKEYTKNDNINFLLLSHEETLKQYPEHHVFVLPTKEDAFGYSVLEAMSYGLPVIVCNHSALPEMVEDNFNGFLLNTKIKNRICSTKEQIDKITKHNLTDKSISKSIEGELTKKMELFIENPDLINKMGKNSINMCKAKFSPEKINKLMDEIYKKSLI